VTLDQQYFTYDIVPRVLSSIVVWFSQDCI